jgi:hypothetical protein
MIARLNQFSAKNETRHHDNDNKPRGKIRLLDLSDPRNLDHASHDAQWDELAMAIGRAMGRAQFAKDHEGTLQ